MRLWISAALAMGLFAIGCSEKASTPVKQAASEAKVVKDDHEQHKDDDHDHDHDKDEAKSGKKERDHSGWWCADHGVPEAQCTQCFSKVAAEFQKKGDWCAEHDRAKSQCFICDPSLKEKFAAQYRAKEGKEPPPLEENAKGKDKHDDEHEKKS